MNENVFRWLVITSLVLIMLSNCLSIQVSNGSDDFDYSTDMELSESCSICCVEI